MKKMITFTLVKPVSKYRSPTPFPFTPAFRNPGAFCFSGVKFGPSSGLCIYRNSLKKGLLACLNLVSAMFTVTSQN